LRRFAFRRTYAPACLILALASMATLAASAAAVTGGASAPPPPGGGATPNLTTSLPKAQLSPDGRVAIAPESAPLEVQKAIWAANRITNKPYRYGGGHGRWRDSGYDRSGSLSFALARRRAGEEPLAVAGLRFDTSARSRTGSRWTKRDALGPRLSPASPGRALISL